MKRILYFISIAALLSACEPPTSTTESSETPNSEQADAKSEVKSDAPASTTQLEEGKIYPFMELKALYQKDWKGEETGNKALDGKIVTVTGKVFGTSTSSELVGNDFKTSSISIEFRGGKFPNPEFGHDVDCKFPPEMIPEVEKYQAGTEVTIRGTIEKQELYIEPKFQYLVLSLTDCSFAPKAGKSN